MPPVRRALRHAREICARPRADIQHPFVAGPLHRIKHPALKINDRAAILLVDSIAHRKMLVRRVHPGGQVLSVGAPIASRHRTIHSRAAPGSTKPMPAQIANPAHGVESSLARYSARSNAGAALSDNVYAAGGATLRDTPSFDSGGGAVQNGQRPRSFRQRSELVLRESPVTARAPSFSDDLRAAASALHASRAPVALTGAGISHESGIPTFRDALTGLWAQYDPQRLATPTAFRRDPKLV